MTDEVRYKIRNTKTGSFSNGVVNVWTDSKTGKKEMLLNWSKKGKEWTTERALKNHLLKVISTMGMPKDWEIVQVTYQPTKPISEWVDAKMLMQVLKK